MFVAEGTIEGGGMLAALRCIASGQQHGLLAVQGDQDLVSIAFVEGKIVAVDAMNRSMEEALSEVLAARGLVAPQQFAAIVDPVLGTGRLAGDVLLEAALVERSELLDAVREQVCEQALQLLRWDQGLFSWTADVESPYQKGMEPLTVAELLVRSSEQQAVGSPLGSAGIELDDHFGRTLSEAVLVLGKDGDWIEEGDTRLWLTRVEGLVHEAMDDSLPASHLLLGLGIESFELRYALQVLFERDLIRRVEGAGSEPSSGQVRELMGDDGSLSDLLASPSQGELEEGDGISDLRFDSPDLDGVEPVDRETSDLDLDRSLFAQDEWIDQFSDREGRVKSSLETLGESFRVDPDGAGRVAQRPETMARVLSVWAARCMALGFVALLASQVLLKGQRHDLRLPYFWQTQSAFGLEDKFWSASAVKIGSALRVYHLLYGRFPDDLEILVDLQLVAPSDLYDSKGRWLAYAIEGDGYSLGPAEGESVLEGLRRRESVDDDFFLDPEFVLQLREGLVPASVRVID